MDKLTQAFAAGMMQRGQARGVDFAPLLKSAAMGGKLSGKADEKGITAKDVSAKQLGEGIKIEQEHTSDPQVAKRIAKDHLAEIPDYYTRLKKMEANVEKDAVAFLRCLSVDPYKVRDNVYCMANGVSKKAESGGFGGVPTIARLAGQRRQLTEPEMLSLQHGLGQWFPKVFQSAGTPVAETLASPFKNSLLRGLLGTVPGAVVGGGLGYLIGKKDPQATITGASIGAAITGTISAIRQFIRRKRENEDVVELMHRLPEEPVLRDLMFQEDRDKLLRAKVQRAVNVARRRLL